MIGAKMVTIVFAFTTSDPSRQTLTEESVFVAVVLMTGYVISLVYQFTNPKETLGGQGEPEGHAGPAWSGRVAIVVLLAAAGLLAVLSEILVSAIEPFIDTFGLSAFFVGVVLIVRPATGEVNPGQLIALAAAVGFGVSIAIVKSLTRTEQTVTNWKSMNGQQEGDPAKLAAYRLTIQDVEDALRRSNIEVPAGRIESTLREFNVTAATDLRRPQEFAQVVVKTVNGFPVRIGDVARVQQGAANERTSVRLNGRDAIGVGVIRQATANPLDLSAGVRELMTKIQKDLPPGVVVEVANDNSVFIDRSIKAVYHTIVEASVLVALVIFLFLRTLRAAIIPLVTIPVALIGTFALMALAGFSINTLTLLALVLAIGLVVDDAIVMLENIYRHIEDGVPPFQAAIQGAREVGFAIVAMTLTLVAVYVPLAFAPGRTGRLFTEFALALAGAVMVSGVVALTLSPMMSSVLLRHNPRPSWFDRSMEHALDALTRGYGAVLAWTLRVRWLVVLVMIGSGVVSWSVMSDIKRELSPMEDRGVVLAQLNAPDGSTLDYTNRYAKAIEKVGENYPEFDRVFATIGNPATRWRRDWKMAATAASRSASTCARCKAMAAANRATSPAQAAACRQLRPAIAFAPASNANGRASSRKASAAAMSRTWSCSWTVRSVDGCGGRDTRIGIKDASNDRRVAEPGHRLAEHPGGQDQRLHAAVPVAATGDPR